MGIGRLRALVALLVALFVVSAAPAAFAAQSPGGGNGGGCGEIHYKRVDGAFGVRSVCSAPPGSVFHAGSGGSVDVSCTYYNPNDPKTAADGSVYLEPLIGTWIYRDISSDTYVLPSDARPPAGVSFDAWLSSFPTFADSAGGNRLFLKTCGGPESAFDLVYGTVVVPPTDPFWEDLPGQLRTLAATVPLEKATLAFTPGGPEVWGGFLTNAPYGVSLGNDGIWHSVRAERIDAMQAWHLTVVASPVSATVIVNRGHGAEEMECDIGANGPVTQWGLPRFDPPTKPANLPACAFTARWAQATSVSVSMRITYRVVGFIGNLSQVFPDQSTTSDVDTWPVVRTEAANTQAG